MRMVRMEALDPEKGCGAVISHLHAGYEGTLLSGKQLTGKM